MSIIKPLRQWDSRPQRFTDRIRFWSSASILCASYNVASTAMNDQGFAKIGLAVTWLTLLTALRMGFARAALGLNASKAHPETSEIQEMMNDISMRAGFEKPIPVIVTSFPESIETDHDVIKLFVSIPPIGRGKAYDYGAAAANRFYSPYKRPTVIIGAETIKCLNDDENASVLAHEAGHILTEDTHSFISNASKVSSGVSFFLMASSFVLSEHIPHELIAGWLVNKFCDARVGQSIEFRADYNAQNIFPHETAHETGLKKIAQNLGFNQHPEKFYFSDILIDLFLTHPSLNRRYLASRSYYQDIQPTLNQP